MKILVPVRYPLKPQGRRTLERALEVGGEDDEYVILHVDLFQDSKNVTREKLRREVEDELGEVDARYVVREGFLVEESILQEAASQKADLIVIGKTRSGRLRRTMRRMIGNDPDIENFLRKKLNAEIEVVG
ncbi:MAG: universal stress protein [Halobacteria archaeon]|nr:universal stress protein [Halobacteria archaeon]